MIRGIPPAEFETPWPALVTLQVHVSEAGSPGKRTDPNLVTRPLEEPTPEYTEGERAGQVSLTGVPRREDAGGLSGNPEGPARKSLPDRHAGS